MTRWVVLPGILTVAARRKNPPELLAIKEAWQAATGRTPSGLDTFSMRSLAFGGRMLIAIGLEQLVVVMVWHSDWGSPGPTLIWGVVLSALGVSALVWRHRTTPLRADF